MTERLGGFFRPKMTEEVRYIHHFQLLSLMNIACLYSGGSNERQKNGPGEDDIYAVVSQ